MAQVKIWEEAVIIPTYEVGEADKNPMFLEKRVYQGSSGKVYPYPATEKISYEKTDKTYQAVFLENEYLKIMVLPELGGRIQRAYDKTNGYDFVYYNRVIKPALVGLAGPWISGGIEFNWPQHHRPTTYMPVDYQLVENEDGSRTLLLNDTDQMYGTKGLAAFTLYPGRAYLEIRGQLYNRTAIPQTFLWWANPAVAVNDETQSVFPPDVHSVMDHGKRDVSRFPIAKGIYYKHDYSEGVDISRYKNIPVPTSYMAETSKYDFVGGYDYGKEAGLLHVADHHFSPGKKQWTWGCGDFGKAWDRNLTDEDGPYIELMTGVYTENQPDFSWLKPFEEKTFTQYFMPYKAVGAVKNATIDAAVNLECEEGHIRVIAYATAVYLQARILLTEKAQILLDETVELSPVKVFDKVLDVVVQQPEALYLQVLAQGRVLVEYQPEKEDIPKLAQPAEAARKPWEIRTNEELLLTARHIEQHRHATWLPDPYYLEGLKRDSGDIRINNAYGMLLYRRGLAKKAEKYFRAAIQRMTWRSPNPYDSEAYYNLGLSLFAQERMDEAYDAFYKAAWSSEQQEMSFYYTAVIQAQKKNYEQALALLEKSLIKNSHNIKARGMKAVLLRKLGRDREAMAWIRESLRIDAFDFVSRMEQEHLAAGKEQEAYRIERRRLMRDFQENYLQTARDYAEAGFYAEAVEALQECSRKYPMLYYYIGYYAGKLGDTQKRQAFYDKAEQADSLYCFPNKLEDIAVLYDVLSVGGRSAKAAYYLGNLYYDKLQRKKAISLWERSAAEEKNFPTVHRNLAIAYYNETKNKEKAREEMEKAFALDETDSRVFLELDQLYKKLGVDCQKRLERYEAYEALVRQRDDAMLEWVTLYNLSGEPKKALDLIMSYRFRPWEGAEGKISGQYKAALLSLAKEKLAGKAYQEAKKLLEQALIYPPNLGEGRLEGTRDNDIWYYLGKANRALGLEEEFEQCMEKARLGVDEPAGMLYYYDQPADMILYKGLACEELGLHREACACFNKLMDYGERHIRDRVEYDYFAVSLPDFMVFEEDLTAKNEAHCYYLMGLSLLGTGEKDKAAGFFREALKKDSSHQKAVHYRKMCEGQ